MRFALFILVFTFILVLLQAYVARSLAAWIASFPLSEPKRILLQRVMIGVMIFLNLWIPARLLMRNFDSEGRSLLKKIFVVPGSIWMICMLMMFFLLVLRDVAFWIVAQFQRESVDTGRRALLQATGLASIGAPFVLTGYGALRTSRDYKIQKVNIVLPQLPAGLEGFKIAHVSDIHSGPYMNEAEMMKVREMMDPLHPQIVALTGDFIDSRSYEIEPVARIFSRCKNDYGIYGCMGNHDLFDDYSVVSGAMKQSGIRMLENTSQTLKINGDELSLVGAADTRDFSMNTGWRKALKGIDPDGFKVLLVHRPRFFEQAKEVGIDLQLSGHTHGGQIVLDLLGAKLSVAHLSEKYVAGYYKEGKSHLYVNSGVGMVFAPVRISVPPEITLITLTRNSF